MSQGPRGPGGGDPDRGPVAGGPDDGAGDGRADRPGDRMVPTSPTVLLGVALTGVVLGRLVRPAVEWGGGLAPVVGWSQASVLVVVSAVLLATARATRAALPAHRVTEQPQLAVNRLLLARASAVVGALVGGGYVGYAVAWLGDPSQLADQRVLRSLLTAAAAALVVLSAVLLERACRVPPGPPAP